LASREVGVNTREPLGPGVMITAALALEHMVPPRETLPTATELDRSDDATFATRLPFAYGFRA
jgi:hypothetical protein